MPSFLFNDFEAYGAAVSDADVRLMLPRLDVAHWEIAAQSVGRIHLQKGLERSGMIAEGAANHGDLMLFIPLSGPQGGNGIDLGPGSVLVIPPGSEFVIRSPAEHAWCSVRLPRVQAIECLGSDFERQPLWPGSRVMETDPHRLDTLRRIVCDAFHTAETNPDTLQQPLAVATLENDLLSACRSVLQSRLGQATKPGRQLIDRGRVIRSLQDGIHDLEPESSSVPVLARNAGVSERTLRSMCLEYFGIGPQRYITLHRLNLARQALLEANPRHTKIAAIAGRLGFWHLGRFSSQYHRMFGELPSKTLAQCPKTRGR
jgi:AraC-like DNA-binding protein